MAYAVKYILQFTSDRGNEIRIEVLKKDYQGEVIYKSLGSSPSLSIEQGDGAIKGSSLVFAMQADIEGELQELYTTDNKQFKVNMYRNEVLSWQGYILPELYSEEYVDAPYDVSVTATDQLATLKAITYQREDVNVSLSTIIEDILSFTQISVPVTYHQNLSALRKGEVPMLVDSHISQAAYNGYSCYDVLTNILLSCNCCIMQINGEWLITSLTNSTTNYYTAGVNVVREHKILGQLGVGEVCPAGTLTMVNNPALKGAKVEYAHMLRNSFLVNADCVDREGWNYTPDSRNPIDIPGEREAFGKIFKTYCWELHPVNIRKDNSLQLWQEVTLEKDERNCYDLSVKTLFSTDAKLLLMAVTYLGSDGVERRLTSEGWIEKWDKSDVNYYIQITGTNKNAGLDAIADIEQYEMSTVQFALPPVDGTMRIGFINSTTDYKDPLGAAPIYVSQVYLTVSGVTGQECTTEVEPNATQEQQGVLLAYGDTFESENAYKLGLNTLKKSSGENITSWWLDNENFSSYYDTMLQEFSRYFGVKKAQLQGIIMGKDVLSDMYADVFSGRVMRLLTAQVDLLADEASVTVEEIVTTTVDFDTVIYATNNTNSFGSSGGGAGISGGASSTAGESLLGVQSDGDVYVKDGRALVGQEGRFENLALPVNAPTERKETRTYLYSSDPSKGAIDIAKIAKWIDEQEEMWVLDAENGVIKTTYNVVSEKEIISHRRASGSGSGGGGGISEITAQMVADALGYVPYSSFNPAGYITSASIPTALKNPYALTINGHTYDGSEAVNITISAGGGVADSVDWANVANKPTTLRGYGITDALSISGGTITGSLTIEQNNDWIPIVFKRGGTSAFIGSGVSLLQLGFDEGYLNIGVNELTYATSGNLYGIIHSGNIGDQSVNYANSAGNADTLGGYRADAMVKSYIDNTDRFTKFTDRAFFQAAYISGQGDFGSLVIPTWGGNNASAYYTAELRFNLDSANPKIRVTSPSGTSEWYTLARTVDNVASATKLQTARTIWGQSFDGSGDVWGTITVKANAGFYHLDSNGGYLAYIGGDSGFGGVHLYNFGYGNSIRLYNDGRVSIPEGNVLIGTTVNQTSIGGTLQVRNNHGAWGTYVYSDNAEVGLAHKDGYGLYVNSTKNDNNIYLLHLGNKGTIFGNSSVVFTAKADGKVGVCTKNPEANFDVNGTSRLNGAVTLTDNTYFLGSPTWGFRFNDHNSNYNNFIIYENGNTFTRGNTLIGTTSDNGAKLQVAGDITATGEVISSRRASSSDARLKDNINRLIAEDCLAMVRNLQPSSWQWKEDGKFSLGFIAQDIEPLMPYAVTRIKDDILGQRLNLQYDQFFAPVVGAIQCLDSEVERLKKRVKYLENKLQEYGYNRY